MILGLWPFLLQGAALAFDEFYFHRHREMRRWERWGHPLDTLIFLGALLWLRFSEPSVFNFKVYVGLAAFSCLMVTKDEWEHHGRCSAAENWLHSVLFVLHPLTLGWSLWLWWNRAAGIQACLNVAISFGSALFLYQTLYWNWWRRDQQ